MTRTDIRRAGFELPPELEADLAESITEADRGETISAEKLIERLRRTELPVAPLRELLQKLDEDQENH
jgi:hypothetical protein